MASPGIGPGSTSLRGTAEPFQVSAEERTKDCMMILLGLVLIAIAVAGGALLFIGTSTLKDPIEVEVLGGTVGLPPLAMLIAGALVILILWLGWVLLVAGIRRSSRRRKERKAAARVAAEELAARDRALQEGHAAHERLIAEERRQRETDAQDARAEADARVAEQHRATEEARRRAEVAEKGLDGRGGAAST